MLPVVAGDFQIHIDHVARLWASGINPYERPCDWVCSLFPYPPMILRLFAWVRFVSTSTAVWIWLPCIAACLAAGAIAAGRTRKGRRVNAVADSLATGGLALQRRPSWRWTGASAIPCWFRPSPRQPGC